MTRVDEDKYFWVGDMQSRTLGHAAFIYGQRWGRVENRTGIPGYHPLPHPLLPPPGCRYFSGDVSGNDLLAPKKSRRALGILGHSKLAARVSVDKRFVFKS